MKNPARLWARKESDMRAVIFGGANGIGSAIADIFYENWGDRSFIIIDRDQHPVYETIQAELPLDGELDVPVNAGVTHVYITLGAPSHRKFDDTTGDKEAQLLERNFMAVTSALRFARQATMHNASYILTSSVSAAHADDGGTIYAASKAAVEALVRNLAREWAPSTVNGIAPGPTATKQFLENVPPENRVIEAGRSPHHRLIEPFEVAEAAVSLSLMTGVSGVVLPVDLAGQSSSRRW